jgi:hypothetical protein
MNPTRTPVPVTRAYRYGFNTQEKEDEISGSAGTHYSAEFWMYDTRTGRRWNLDPVDQISISNYAAFANNPVVFIDHKGDKWGDSEAKSEAKALMKDFRRAIITTKQFVRDGYVDKKDGSERIEDLRAGIKEVKAMGKSKGHIFYTNNDADDSWVEIKGNNEYVLNYKLNHGSFVDVGIRAHEFKHGYQFIAGKLSQDYNYYDQTDEVEAFKRQFATFTDLSNWGLSWVIKGRDGEEISIRKMSDIDVKLISKLPGMYYKIPENDVNSCNYSPQLIQDLPLTDGIEITIPQ